MRALLDTSVLIGDRAPQGVEAAISVASLAELHFGVLVATDDDERALRTQRLGAIESAFDPLHITAEIAREWGRLAAAVSTRGGQPRKRTMDLAIAATANVHRVPLLTENANDFRIISDLVDVRTPRSTKRHSVTEARLSARMLSAVDHVGVAVDDIDSALAVYRDTLGMPLVHRETVADQGVEAALLDVGDGHVELLLPLGPDTAVGRFLARRGPGLHHVAYRVPSVEDALRSLAAGGVRLIDERPRRGIRGSLVAFIHPASTGGVLTEIVQPAAEGH